MEEYENELMVVDQQPTKEEKKKKSLNRRFGFLLGLAIILFAILVFEIVSLFIR